MPSTNYLVTGSAGFLGRYILEQCLQQQDVRVFGVYRREPAHRIAGVVYVHCDISSLASVQAMFDIIQNQHGCSIDAVIHSAAAVPSVSMTYEQTRVVNVVGTANLIKAARAHAHAHPLSFVHVSSASILIDKHKKEEGYDGVCGEDLPHANVFVDDYARTKSEAELLVLKENSENFRVCVLRPPAIAGPDDGHFISKILSVFPVAAIPGDSTQAFDVVLVSRLAELCVKAANQLGNAAAKDVSGQIYMVGAGQRWSKRDLLFHPGWGLTMKCVLPEIVCGYLASFNERFFRVFGFAPFDDSMRTDTVNFALCSWWFSTKKAERELGYRPPSLLEFVNEIQSLASKQGRTAGIVRVRVRVLMAVLACAAAYYVLCK